MEAIKKLLDLNKRNRPFISIVGDCMIDQYYSVNADKISPEFPIVRMLSEDENDCLVLPGGASNVAMMFKHFNVDVLLFGLLDYYGKTMLNACGLSTDQCVLMPKGKIPVKRRLYHGEFPLCRWDIEKRYYGLTYEELYASQLALYDNFTEHDPDVVILSDYDKGLFAPMPCGIHKHKKRWLGGNATIVDPKKGPLEDWEGCYIFKPNSKEAKELSGGLTQWQDQCQFFNKKLNCKAVVITQGGQGVVGIIDNKFFQYHPTAKVTADSMGYSGAGDCFIAFLAMGIANLMDIEEAAAVAYNAAAIYVTKRHNQPISPEELLRLVDPISVKLKMPEADRNYKLIMTNGVFDCGLTAAHVEYLQQAKALGDRLLVAVNSDESVRRLKGDSRPIMPLKERMEVLASLQAVDFVVSFDEDTPLNLIKAIRPSLLVKGGDYKEEEVAGYGLVDIKIVKKIDSLSTTQKIEKIRKAIDG